MGFIDLVDVAYCYPGQKRPIFSHVDLSIFKEGVTAVTGPNGSGKTTLSKLLAGILTPTEGFVRLNGQLMISLTLAQIGRQVGYVFQNPAKQLFCGTVEEEIGFGLANLALPEDRLSQKVGEIMDYFELTRYARSFPLSLSAGEKRRLAIAAVFALEPDLLVLDEPTAGVDTLTRQKIWECIMKMAESGCAVVVTSHYQTEVRLCGRNLHMERPVQL